MAAVSSACPICTRDMTDDPPICPDCMCTRPQAGWPAPATPKAQAADPDPPPPAPESLAPRGRVRCPNPACQAQVAADAGSCVYCGATLGARVSGWSLDIGGRRVAVTSDGAVLIGRVDESPFASTLASRENVSRRHCEVRVRGRLQVRDLDSTNGTFLNGRRVGGEWEDVPQGSTLRLASNVAVRVEPA